MNGKRLLGMMSALLLAGCQAVPMPAAPGLRQQRAGTPVQRQQLRQDVKIFQQPVAVEIEPSRLIFTSPVEVRPNQVLMGRSLKEQDFLRRATRVQAQGQRLIVDTVPASLFEAFSEFDMNTVRTARAPERISLSGHRFNIGGVVDIVLDLGVKPDFSDAHLRIKDSRLYVRVAPRFELDSRIRTEYTFFSTQAQLSPEPVPQPAGSVSFLNARYLAWVGPVPLVFHLKPGAALSYGHKAEGKVIVTTELEGSFKAGVEMEAALGEKPVTKTESEYAFDGRMLPPELRLTGIARARLHLPTLHLDTEIAGLVGPFVEASPYVDGRFQRTLTVSQQQTTVYTNVSSHLGLAIDGGITPTRLFGKELTGEIRLRILDKRIKQLYKKETTDVVSNP